MASHQVYAPHPALRPYVRYYWSLDLQFSGEDMLNLQLMADRFPRIVIQCLNGRNALHGYPNEKVVAATLKGIASKAVLIQMEPTYSHVAVSFFPHGPKSLFGVDAQETTDAVLDLHHFCSRDVIEKIIFASCHTMRIELLDIFLLTQLNTHKTIDWRVVDFAYRSSRAHHGCYSKDYGISGRQFERKFLQAVGFTPSYYKRVVRFEEALLRVQNNQFETLSDIAYDLNYSDQSHFNREFKQFSGLTPIALQTMNKIVEDSGSMVAE